MISTNVVAVLFLLPFIHLLTLLCNLPALNKMMCPNQPPLVLFQWQKNHQVMHLLVETVPKVVHSTNCNTILFMGDHICLRFYKQSMHNMLYMFTSMHIQYNFTFVPAFSAFHTYRYMHRLHLDNWNLCSGI